MTTRAPGRLDRLIAATSIAWPSVLVLTGFTASAVGSALGIAPPWPIRWVWVVMAILVALSIVVYLCHRSGATLRWTTLMIMFAAVTRALGYAADDIPWGQKLSAIGAWLVVMGLAAVRHRYRRSEFF